MTNKKLPILITVPHCSTFVPVELRRKMNLSDKEIQRYHDHYTDEIYDVENAHVLKAKISRLVADPNRAPDDIEMECRLCHDGVVVSITEDGKVIYKEPPKLKEIFERVEKYHDSFHQEIESLAPEMLFLIDGHSLWSVGPDTKKDSGKERADITLGNRDFTTCSRTMTLKIARFFQERDLSVSINDPYPGKYLIGYHCSRRGLPGIQIEINQKLYMNEHNFRRNKKMIKYFNEIMGGLAEMIAEDFE
ncbi:N-formylglutamate amidohydrolase [Candidatus Peregrinibacteria bacterium]|jgi:N-formylglutamate deformylase|nr:N-formylglutamate amidohydrolase [Candidatus Peregrinibacteria bacterium]MBT7737075.1 N-formylglutamate amidohydrolase [Candidatus Peregrinibacteria bacterium]